MKEKAVHHNRLVLLILLFSASMLVFLWYSVLSHLEQEKKGAVTEAVQRNDNLAIALEQYTIRTIQGAEAVMHLVTNYYSTQPPPKNQPYVIAADMFDSALVSSVMVTNEKGEIIATDRPKTAPADSMVRQRSAFKFHQQYPHDTLLMSIPAYALLTGRTAIFFTRRINKKDGSFGGMVQALIEPSRFIQFFADANLNPYDLFSLISMQGITYARRNGSSASWGEDISRSRLLQLVQQNSVGAYFAPDMLYRIPTHFSFRKIPQYPIIITVGAAEKAVLLDFYKQKKRELWIGAVITLLLVTFTFFIIRMLALRRKTLLTLVESEERYRSFFEHSMDAILLIRNGKVLRANPSACAIFQMNEAEISAHGRQLLSDSGNAAIAALRADHRANGTAKGEIMFRRKDEKLFPAEITSVVYRNALGEDLTTIIIRDLTERKHLEARLFEEQERVQRRITEQVIDAQEKERAEIGRELHDNVNQVLTSAKLYLELAVASPQLATPYISKSMQLVAECINEIRNLSRDLAAPTLGTRSLTDSINALAEVVRSSSGIDIQFEPLFCDESISMGQKLALYRIVQEQLNNIIKHAKANRAEISLLQAGNQLQLTIRDNGQGFDPARKTNGIGLNNIINRAKVLEGEVSIHSAPDQGFTLQVQMPVQAA